MASPNRPTTATVPPDAEAQDAPLGASNAGPATATQQPQIPQTQRSRPSAACAPAARIPAPHTPAAYVPAAPTQQPQISQTQGFRPSAARIPAPYTPTAPTQQPQISQTQGFRPSAARIPAPYTPTAPTQQPQISQTQGFRLPAARAPAVPRTPAGPSPRTPAAYDLAAPTQQTQISQTQGSRPPAAAAPRTPATRTPATSTRATRASAARAQEEQQRILSNSLEGAHANAAATPYGFEPRDALPGAHPYVPFPLSAGTASATKAPLERAKAAVESQRQVEIHKIKEIRNIASQPPAPYSSVSPAQYEADRREETRIMAQDTMDVLNAINASVKPDATEDHVRTAYSQIDIANANRDRLADRTLLAYHRSGAAAAEAAANAPTPIVDDPNETVKANGRWGCRSKGCERDYKYRGDRGRHERQDHKLFIARF